MMITKEALLERRDAMMQKRASHQLAMAACDGALVAINELLQALEAPEAETEKDQDHG